MIARRRWLAALERRDRSPALSRAVYRRVKSRFERELAELQRRAAARRLPVILVMEGSDAAGKGRMINELIRSLDPRLFRVLGMPPADKAGRDLPFLARYAAAAPARGRMVVFDRSWSFHAVDDRVRGRRSRKEFLAAIEDILAFERQWHDGGGLLVKLYLHLSKKEQHDRTRARRADPGAAWSVTRDDRWRHRHYADYVRTTASLMAATHAPHAPWRLVDAHDVRRATLASFRAVIGAFRAAVRARAPRPADVAPRPVRAPHPSLARTDLSASMTRADYERTLERRQRRLYELGQAAWKAGLPVALVFEGWDAAGKGGAIRRLTNRLDPRGYEVVPISAPTEAERDRHYLWRFWTRMPGPGRFVIFDRSWYGRVLVERVEGFCRRDEWRRAYREIAEMERHLARGGVLLLKFWLHIDPDTQLARFRERERVSYKRWKITPEDWRNRRRWNAYRAAAEEMLARTHAPWAPWHVVAFNNEHDGRIRVLDTVIAALERRRGR